MRPPPPTGTTTVASASALLGELDGDSALAGDGPAGRRRGGRRWRRCEALSAWAARSSRRRCFRRRPARPTAADGPDPLALLAWRGGRHEDPARMPRRGTGEGQPLRVVAGAGADHPAGPLLGVEPDDEVVGAPDLVGAARPGGLRASTARVAPSSRLSRSLTSSGVRRTIGARRSKAASTAPARRGGARRRGSPGAVPDDLPGVEPGVGVERVEDAREHRRTHGGDVVLEPRGVLEPDAVVVRDRSAVVDEGLLDGRLHDVVVVERIRGRTRTRR